MIRLGAVSVMVLAACLASHEASAKPARGKAAKPAAHRTVPAPKPRPDLAGRAVAPQESGEANAAPVQHMVVAGYVPIGSSKALPRGFRGPRPAPNRVILASAAGAGMAAPAPSASPEQAPSPQPASDARRSLEGRTAKNQFAQAQTSDTSAPPPAAQTTAQPVAVSAARVASAADTPAQTPAPVRAAADAPAPAPSPPAPATGGQTRVGEEPDKSKDVNISVLADRGGVLTPRGTLVVNTGFDYTHTSVSRFFFDGVELAEAVLVGDFQFDDIDRNTISESVGLQYGLTRRLAMSVGATAMARSDRQVNTALATGDPARVLENEGHGFGDIDFGFQYQINRPSSGWPYYVANLRFKSDTGKGPFDVRRDLQTGLEKELPTGSGFWSMEPSITVIWPSDPAVLYANIGYRWNMARDINKVVKDEFKDASIPGPSPIIRTRRTILEVKNVDPGDSVSASMGMGFGLNDQISLSLGYSHSWVMRTESTQTLSKYLIGGLVFLPGSPVNPAELEGTPVTSRPKSAMAQVGSLQIGTSVNVNQRYGFNVNLSVGVTSDAPDVTVGIRVPFTYRLTK